VTESHAAAGRGKGKNKSSRYRKGRAKQQQQQQQHAAFCTQLCLLGLVRGLEVGWARPNIRARLPTAAAWRWLPARHRLNRCSLDARLAAQFAASPAERHCGLEWMDRCG
jgi:hypothetical protein